MSSSFQSESESSATTSVNGRVNSLYQRAKNKDGRKARLSVVKEHGKPPIALIEKQATVGCLSISIHPEAEKWAPPEEALRLANRLLHKPVQVCIYPRRMVKTIWEQDHIDRRYDKELYAFRAYAGKDYCRIFVDETETPESALWVFFHELAHIALTASPYLFKAYRFLTPEDYFESDDAHERDPEEQMANAIAGAYLKMLNYYPTDYPRHWWRSRVTSMEDIEKLASIYCKRYLREHTKRAGIDYNIYRFFIREIGETNG